MSQDTLRTKLLCCLLLFVFPTAMMSAGKAAMLYGTGKVMINANVVTHASAVFAGDKIQTGSDAAATLRFPGTQINLPENSSIIYQPNRVVVDSGRALFQAKQGTVAQLAGLTISPASGSAKFQLINTREKVLVAALDGPLAVSDGTHSVVLPAGHQISQVSAVASGPVSAPASTPAASVAGGFPGWAVGTIAAGVGGGTVGGLAAAGTFANPSPSIP